MVFLKIPLLSQGNWPPLRYHFVGGQFQSKTVAPFVVGRNGRKLAGNSATTRKGKFLNFFLESIFLKSPSIFPHTWKSCAGKSLPKLLAQPLCTKKAHAKTTCLDIAFEQEVWTSLWRLRDFLGWNLVWNFAKKKTSHNSVFGCRCFWKAPLVEVQQGKRKTLLLAVFQQGSAWW